MTMQLDHATMNPAMSAVSAAREVMAALMASEGDAGARASLAAAMNALDTKTPVEAPLGLPAPKPEAQVLPESVRRALSRGASPVTAVRRWRGMTQWELARKARLRLRDVRALEAEETKRHLDTVARSLNVSAAQLVADGQDRTACTQH